MNHLIPGSGLALVIAYVSYKVRFLTFGGAVATFFIGTLVFGFGGLSWSVPLLAFFILSSLLSRTGKRTKVKYELIFEKGSRRDYKQVLANGGVAAFTMILYMITRDQLCYVYYLSTLASASADTWATEIGTLTRQQPRLITSFKRVPAGTSGGMTVAGTLGGFAGAFVLTLSGLLFVPGEIITGPALLLIVTICGFAANLADSFLGATVQIQYQCLQCSQLTEKKFHCNDIPTKKTRGLYWLDNDMVNLSTTAIGWLLSYIGMFFYTHLTSLPKEIDSFSIIFTS